MRAGTIAGLTGLAGLLAAGTGAVAQMALPQEMAPVPPAAHSIEEMSALAHRRSAEAAERQAAFDRLIGERGNRAARSVCDGCGGTATGRASLSPPPRMRAGAERELTEEPQFDPAQARLD